MPYFCSICEEESTTICASCTKDACHNHLCPKCRACSDCCACELTLDEPEPHHSVAATQTVREHETGSAPAS